MTNVTPRFIYFDLGNVLLTFSHQMACENVGQLVGLPAEKIKEVMFASGLQSRYEQGAITSREMYQQFCEQCCLERPQDWPDYEAFHLAASDIFHLNVPVIPIVAHLQSAGYPLGILSDTCEAHWKFVSSGRFTIVERLFQVAVLSFEEQVKKPDRRIYDVAIERAGVMPNEIFYVDDRLENVAGACAAGIDAVLLSSPQQLAADLRARGVRFNY